MKIKSGAFTLAEVLITLGVIGVVAAMTIPTLSIKVKQSEVSAKLPKAYATITNAAKMYQADNGVDITDFDTTLSAREFLDTYFKPYLAGSSACTGISGCYTSRGGKAPLILNKSTKINITEGLILSDGSLIGIINSNTSYNVFSKLFFIDINGSKGDNLSGHDIFNFILVSGSAKDLYGVSAGPGFHLGGIGQSFIPFTTRTIDQLLGTDLHRTCNKNAPAQGNNHGDACAALLAKNGWKFPKGYPW